MLRCTYLDHKSSARNLLADLHECAPLWKESWQHREVILSTCLRYERYYFDNLESGYVLPLNWCQVDGIASTLNRLARIACGIESEILGERFIEVQVAKAFAASPVATPLGALGAEAIAIARTVRERHLHSASTDYDSLTFQVLRKIRSSSRVPKMLVLIGSGMLARAIARRGGSEGYERVAVVTRSPRTLRQDVDGLWFAGPPKLFKEHGDSAPFDCVIATTSIDALYLEDLMPIFESRSCASMIDLSAIEISDSVSLRQPRATLRSSHFHKEIQSANAQYERALQPARALIDDLVVSAERRLRARG